ncbi:hypothetical protein JHN63_49015 [Streptomyces sp. MBT65]|uniref:hypothetical protein n=1 Tax=unclassified Streptomyces TaxID=2593676 RepID=UPI00190A630E|nr:MULTISPECIES: hypothetical protein [unclassified Streptomyces]MBK3581571.1 hypothetical protein [Streptomyces sp. MBT65]MBK3633357.1 hypothetical protein [Streptomyces sp. MBT97]
MTHRYTSALALVLLLVGQAAGVLGLIGKNDDLWQTGLFVTLTAVPLLIARTVHNSQHVTADQIADADRAGYVRALDHVARGLLDAPTPPRPGRRGDRAEQDAGNVITLRPNPVRPAERKAQ